MSGHLLSPLHIQKLGHPIEEIRRRALASVLSKYNLYLVDETNLENTRQLLDKLLNWFDFECHPEEEKVLKLILKILSYENSELILKEIGIEDFKRSIKVIEGKLNAKYSLITKDIKDRVAKIQRDLVLAEATIKADQLSSYSSKLSNGVASSTPFTSITDTPEMTADSDCLIINCLSSNSKRDPPDTSDKGDFLSESKKTSTFRLEYFPWHNLVASDRHVLLSIYEGLRYIDNKTSVVQSCQFFRDVILKDFPTEIFIQRPLIVQTFFALLDCDEDEIRLSVLKCLTEAISCLKVNFQEALDLSIINYKQKAYANTTGESAGHESDEARSERSGLPERFHLNLGLSSDDDDDETAIGDETFDDEDVTVLQKHQSTLPNFCFMVAMKCLPHLAKECSTDEKNLLLMLLQDNLSFISVNLKPSFWYFGFEVQKNLYQLFGQCQEALKFQKTRNKITYMFLLALIFKFLKSLEMPKNIEAGVILPRSLQIELSNAVSDFVLVFLYPNMHENVILWVEKLLGQKEKETVQDFKDCMLICESMKSALKIMSKVKFKKKTDKLDCLEKSLLSLDYHKNCSIIEDFVKSCLLKWPKTHLKEKERNARDKIFIKLLSHSDNGIKTKTYQEVLNVVIKHLGVEEAAKPTFELPGERMEFLFHADVLTEIICHGLNSVLPEVQKCSQDVIIHLLKAKFHMSEEMWTNFLNSLTPCLPLLQCYADKDTPLGRCVTRMLDPDVAETIDLSTSDILKGNLRLLFSRDSLTRDEAISRLCWLLTKEDPHSEKLPRMSVLRGLNLNSICSSVKPQEPTRLKQSFYSVGCMCDVIEMLSAVGVEPSVRRSALSQISVMLEDSNLHSTFLEQKGLGKILDILANCLVEKEFHNYPDSVMPIVNILKLVALHNPVVRQELSIKLDIYFCILRSLLLFSNDERLRQDACELMYLLLYNDVIINVPPSRAIKCKISLPELIIIRMCVPFFTHIHWRSSRHLEPSMRDTLMKREECARIIRVHWTIQWFGNLSSALAMEINDLKSDIYSPGLPDDMKLTSQDLVCLKKCALHLSVRQKLYNIQNATTHEAVIESIQKIHSYLMLYKLECSLVNGTYNVLVDIPLSDLPWQKTLERFLISMPTCQEDEFLLAEVIQFVRILLKTVEVPMNWVTRLLTDELQSLPNILKTMGNEDLGAKGREIRHEIIKLTQELLVRRPDDDSEKWAFFISLLSNHLTVNNKEEFYNVAFIDWLLSLLVDLTGKWKWNYTNKMRLYEDLICRVMELIVAFHCSKDSSKSFMGINIVKNSLLILNQLLSDLQNTSKGWEQLWSFALRSISKHESQANYSWIMSLWFIRDPFIRAASFQLLSGFSKTPRGCELLLEGLGIEFEHMWHYGFQILLDDEECSLVREHCATLLSNLTSHGSSVSADEFLQHVTNIHFYQEMEAIVSKLHFEASSDEISPLQHHLKGGGDISDSRRCSVTTPSFLSAISALLLNIVYLKPALVIEEIVESGLFSALLSLFADIPLSESNSSVTHKLDALKMFIIAGKMISKCISESSSSYSLLTQCQPTVNSLFQLLDFELYSNENPSVSVLRNQLWKEILDIFSHLLTMSKGSNNGTKGSKELLEDFGLIAFKNAATEDRLDSFISTLYLSILSDDCELRQSSMQFLINILAQEGGKKCPSLITSLLNRRVTLKATELASTNCSKGISLQENLCQKFSIRVCNILMQTYTLSCQSKKRTFKSLVSDALGSLLAASKAAQTYCIENGLVESIALILKQIFVKLNLETIDSLRKLSEKRRIDPVLDDMENLFQLTCNLLYGNEEAKDAVAGCGISDVVHKLWPWCSARNSLLIFTLKMLCTYTHSSDRACRSMVLTSCLSGLGLKKSAGSVTLIHAIMNQVSREMDLISKTHDSQILRLCLQLLSHCCFSSECRTVITKSPFLQCVARLHPSLSIKRRLQGDEVVDLWFDFLIILTSYQEGQLELSKGSEVLELLILTSSHTKKDLRVKALKVLRNICFHQLNRLRMLSCCPFLSLMVDKLCSKQIDEIHLVVHMIWALSYNSQKAKLILRTANFEEKLQTARRECNVTGHDELVLLVERVLEVLKNK